MLFGCFFCCLGGGVFYFLPLGRGPRPCPNSKRQNTTPPEQQKKKKNTHPNSKKTFLIAPLRSLILSGNVRALHVRGRVVFCCLGGVCVSFFAVWAGGVFHFLPFGRGRVSFFAIWAGGLFSFFAAVRKPLSAQMATRKPREPRS